MISRPFDLHPEYPPEGMPRAALERRYGSDWMGRLRSMFEQAGLPCTDRLERVPNSRKSLMLGEHARDRGKLRDLHPRLFAAYWEHGRDLGDPEVLVDEARGVGLDPDEARAALEDPALLERVEAWTRAASELGAGGVPAWLVDERLLIPGAQPHEVFDRVMDRLGYAPRDGEPPARGAHAG